MDEETAKGEHMGIFRPPGGYPDHRRMRLRQDEGAMINVLVFLPYRVGHLQYNKRQVARYVHGSYDRDTMFNDALHRLVTTAHSYRIAVIYRKGWELTIEQGELSCDNIRFLQRHSLY